VRERLTAALRDHQQGIAIRTDERQTLAAFLERWLADVVQPSVRPSTFTSYRMLTRRHVIPGLGQHRLSKLTPQDVQTFYNGRRAVGLSPRTVQYLHAILRRALGQAVKWSLVPRNVALLTERPNARRPEIRPLDPDQIRAFLTAAAGDRLEALYTVAVAVGLRQGEALGLRWEDVDLDGATLQVRHALQRIEGRMQLVEPKTDKSKRTIALPAVAVTALRAHRTRQLEERLWAGSRWQEWGLVFTSTIGTPLDGTNVTKGFQRLLHKAGLPHQRFHDLRHACATLLLVQGTHPRVVMEVLGHSQIGLTMNTYSHVMPSLRREAAESRDAVWGA
jgi:integrase